MFGLPRLNFVEYGHNSSGVLERYSIHLYGYCKGHQRSSGPIQPVRSDWVNITCSNHLVDPGSGLGENVARAVSPKLLKSRPDSVRCEISILHKILARTEVYLSHSSCLYVVTLFYATLSFLLSARCASMTGRVGYNYKLWLCQILAKTVTAILSCFSSTYTTVVAFSFVHSMNELGSSLRNMHAAADTRFLAITWLSTLFACMSVVAAAARGFGLVSLALFNFISQ